MAITRPMLPPRAGYVEVEVDGERVYKNAATGVLLRDETPAAPADATLVERIAALEATNAELTEALELLLSGVTE